MGQQQGITSPGTLDPAFNKTGILEFPIPEISGIEPSAVLALPQGKLLTVIPLSGINAGYAVARLNADGSLDKEFGANKHGFVLVPLDTVQDLSVFGISPAVNGGCLIVGQAITDTSGGLLIMRHLPDGRLDTSLNETGILYIPYEDFGSSGYKGVMAKGTPRDNKEADDAEQSSFASSTSASVQADGKILLLGNAIDEFGIPKGIVLRRHPDGSPDETFNGTGAALIELEGFAFEYSSSDGIELQADGRMLVCGSFYSNDGQTAYVTRLTATGRVDPDFNGGLAVTVFSPSLIRLRAMTVRESDGRVIAVGSAKMARGEPWKGLIVALNSTGSYNLPFNNGKPLFADFVSAGLSWEHCVTQANGSIVVSGFTGNGFVTKELSILTARYLSDGSPDTTFNGTGFAVFDDDLFIESISGMSMKGTDRIFVCGALWTDAESWPYISGGVLLCYRA